MRRLASKLPPGPSLVSEHLPPPPAGNRDKLPHAFAMPRKQGFRFPQAFRWTSFCLRSDNGVPHFRYDANRGLRVTAKKLDIAIEKMREIARSARTLESETDEIRHS